MGVQALPTGVFGPLPEGSVGLILGRSSLTLQGLQVLPGVIDNDYTGEIKVMASSPRVISTVSPGQRFAQLLLLPLHKTKNKAVKGNRGAAGFGSSDIYWAEMISSSKPMMTLWLDEKKFTGLVDTGADVTIISKTQWPQTWPTEATITHLTGIGQSRNPERSSKLLTWKDEKGHHGHIQPYIVAGLPFNLWGRDLLAQIGMVIGSPNDIVTAQMLKNGYVPGTGLGKNQDGILDPIQTKSKTDRTGLGHF